MFDNIIARRYCRSTGSQCGSGSTRPGTNSAPESTRPRVNSAGSTRPVYFPYGELGYHIHDVPSKKCGRSI